MTYEERVEAAIAANDIDELIRFAYGYPCKCIKMKGEPMCVCKMQAQALRAKVVPLSLFRGAIQRVEAPSESATEPRNAPRSIFAFLRRWALNIGMPLGRMVSSTPKYRKSKPTRK